MRYVLIVCLLAMPAPAPAQVAGPRTGLADLDAAWDICTRQSGAAFIPLCSALRVIRAKFPQTVLPAPAFADHGSGNLAFVESVVARRSLR